MNNINSVYIHIPFCKNICNYCDFCKMYYNKKLINSYLNKLQDEIKSIYQTNPIKTIYIGGGTPSSLSALELNKLFKIIKMFNMTKLKEFTIECNIEDINEEKLKIFKKNKVNRLSIGVQSFNEKILTFLGRNIKKDQIIKNINLAKKYFNNINIDLIYGVRIEDLNILNDDLKEILKLNISHVSAYGLIKEEKTMLSINNYVELDDNNFYLMYKLINKILKDNKYLHYEISNYAKKGYQSIHNLTYWNNDEYYGFGLGASGFVNNVRYDNTRSLANYLKGEYVLNKKEQTTIDNMENEMILGLRKIRGVSDLKFYKKFNKKISDVFDTKRLSKKNKNYFIKESNLFLSNSILVDFLL